MPLSAAERQRRCREKRKNQPEKVDEVKKKDLDRYHARKKLVKDMTPQEQNLIKKKWQKRNKTRREKLKAVENLLLLTPASIPPPGSPRPCSPIPEPNPASARGRRKVRKDRSKLYRDNIQLKEQIRHLKKKLEKHKKTIQRKNKKEKEINYSRLSKEDKTAGKKYEILSNAVKERYKKVKNIKAKRKIQSIFKGKNIKTCGIKLELLKDTLGVNRAAGYRAILPKCTLIKRKIHAFYLRDDVSRATAGKKETVTSKKMKMQKRILLDTMKNLYKSFQKENSNLKCHYSYFVKHKPFYVIPPSVDSRNTCLCKTHVNIEYMTNAMYKNRVITSNDLNDIISRTVCDVNSLLCMQSKCTGCESKNIKYYVIDSEKMIDLTQWVRTSEIIQKSGKNIKVSKNIKKTEGIKIGALVDKFEKDFKVFKGHVINIKKQYKAYRQCIDGLSETEVALHIDYSENYACKHHEEIQSHHFGGSRNQVTLHTAVLYQLTAEKEKLVTSFSTVSPDHNHGPAAIWAHLHPIFDYVQRELPHIKTVHIFSDGPATQYKQKNNFYLISTRFFDMYRFSSMTWNFFESGHGKGAADGVGGSLKRLADNFVATGHDIVDASQFFEVLKDRSKTKLFYVSHDEIAQILQLIPDKVIPLKGTMQVHQLIAERPGLLTYRALSCFCGKYCSCYNVKTYCPLPEEVIDDDSLTSEAEEPLTDITNLMGTSKGSTRTRGHYDKVYSSSTSDDEDKQPLSYMKETLPIIPGTSYDTHDKDKDVVHPLSIRDGVHVLVKIDSDTKKEYKYLGVAKGDMDEDGDLRVMFYKAIGDTGKLFKLNESDVSDVTFEQLVKIVATPKAIKKGRRVLYEFNQPIEVFEKI